MSREDCMLVADGFEAAFIGYAYPWQNKHAPTAIYDRDKCIEILAARDNMTEEEAEEFFDFNVVGAYVGETTPIFMSKSTLKDCLEWMYKP